MYYLGLIKRFWNFNQRVNLGPATIAMYLYLLKLANDNNGNDITISDVAISNMLGLTRKTVKPTKEKLKNLGLIEYVNKNGLPCSYKLLLNYSLEIEPQQVKKRIVKSKFNAQLKEDIQDFQLADLSVEDTPEIKKQEEETPFDDSGGSHLKTDGQPSLEEFIEYARTTDVYETFLDSDIKEKYFSWADNDWKNASNRPIINWRSSLKSTLPYMKNKTDNKSFSIESIPNIKRPK